MASGGIEGFYRQKKKGGISKPSPSASKKKSAKLAGGGATVGAGDLAQSPALITHGSFDLQNDYGGEEERLRQFDMDMRYGPCLGLTRLQRWERASAMGLDPPAEIRAILRATPAMECLWEGRV